ncbi:hypothetical protein AGABI1DRAFT_130437 [Agaricus bisporus var. burnettii JB137-S8]|uniref:Protein kinase domain-containing protein n=1 Tax=Agaricus bisporus var. burnettii (strain JB137-S8 / ATCC MYA-4627 / FGSC 10392) TaxID=597362 RepID=K5XR67_AGABU|nr:uncharacterized protein AGABI1DRAFT_130437 [Agaricus bisporus var. burnettii JB137-S8]EKM77350.1 hypothetical protein AGABI1DRAFT_130437 [Agaricus bisporus var. burnettii JB137-S8]
MADEILTTIPIPFPFPPEDSSYTTLEKCYAFWDLSSTAEWFEQRGYTLYKRKIPKFEDELEPNMYPVLECKAADKMNYPFPHYDTGRNSIGKLHGRNYNGKIVYAQEVEDPSHHVVIKLIATDSEEHRILCFLQSQDLKVLEENCLVPVLNILSNGPYSFVVMPRQMGRLRVPSRRWASPKLLSNHAFTTKDTISFTAHFSDEDTDRYKENDSRMQLQWADALQHCLFDFDLSMMLPPDTDRTRCRLPYRESWIGSWSRTHDTSQGEFDYDPFAFDVGMLGDIFCTEYQHLCRHIPMLAPFLDRMTTRNIPKRFIAAEALEFFEVFLPKIPTTDLHARYARDPEARESYYDIYDRWKDLPPDFIEEWKDYKEPRIPLRTILLRWLCSFERMAFIVPAVRLFFYRLTHIRSRTSASLCP